MKAGPKPFTLRSLWSSKRFRYSLLLFCVCNALIYSWIALGHDLVPFNRYNYIVNSSHFIADSRITDPNSFHFLEALGQYDAQWYLKIAADGYPKLPSAGWPIYAFPPAYPIVLAISQAIFGQGLVGAFVLTQFLLITGFGSVYWLVSRWYSEKLANKTVWLLYLYPFSIFFRSYYSEGLFLIILVVLLDALRSQRWFRASVAAGWLALVKLLGVAGIAVVAVQAIGRYRKNRISLHRLVLYGAICLLPLLLFGLFCYLRTGDPLYFIRAQSNWYKPHLYFPGSAVLWSLLHIDSRHWHLFHSSRIDLLSVCVFGLLIFLSRRWLPRNWWLLSLLLWLIPIMTSDTMSTSRYQVINLPIFIYVAHRLNGWKYGLAIAASLVGLAVVSILFSNWVWIG